MAGTSFARRAFGALIGVAAIAFMLVPAQPGGAEFEADSEFASTAFFGKAWGGDGAVAGLLGEPLLTIGEIAPQYLGCQGPEQSTNSVNKLNLDLSSVPLGLPLPKDAVTTGTVVNSGNREYTPDAAHLYESSTIQNVDLLGGLITATALESRVHVTKDASGVDHHTTIDGHPGEIDGSTGVTFANLKIAGATIPIEPAPNTTVPLPGLGRVVLNEQKLIGKSITQPGGGTQRQGIQVTAIHVYLDGGLVNLGEIALGVSQGKVSGLPGTISASAYTTKAAIKPLGGVGRQALNLLDCVGTDGVPDVLTQAGVTVPNPLGGTLLSTGTAVNTVVGTLSPTAADAHSIAQVQGVSVLDGLVTADLIEVKTDTVAGPGGVESTWTTKFINLSLDGTTLIEEAEVAPWTRYEIPGIGRLILNGRNCASDNADPKQCNGPTFSSIQAFAIRLVIEVPGNPLGLPVGAEVKIGEATSSVRFVPGG